MTSRPIRPVIMCLLACALASGCKAPGKPGPAPKVPRPEDITDFATLYAQNCAACHGENGRNGAAIALANPVYLAIAGTTNIQRIAAKGVPNTSMPPFSKSAGGMLTDKQIAILAQGMASTWGNPSALAGHTPPTYAGGLGNPAQGEKAFATFCARCHGADATGAHLSGGNTTGSLVDPAYLALISDQGLRSFILAGQTWQDSHDWRSYSPAHALNDAETTDIVAWLTSHRIAAPGAPYKPQP